MNKKSLPKQRVGWAQYLVAYENEDGSYGEKVVYSRSPKKVLWKVLYRRDRKVTGIWEGITTVLIRGEVSKGMDFNTAILYTSPKVAPELETTETPMPVVATLWKRVFPYTGK